MRRHGASTGYLQVIGEGGSEADTMTCAHCQFVIVIRPDRGLASMKLNRCGQCFKAICNKCVGELQKGRCAPWEKRLEQMERRSQMLRATGVE